MGLCALFLQLKGLCACADEGGELKALSHIPKSEGFMRCFPRGPYSRHRLTATPSMLDLCSSEEECKKDALHTAVQVCPPCSPSSIDPTIDLYDAILPFLLHTRSCTRAPAHALLHTPFYTRPLHTSLFCMRSCHTICCY